MEVIGWQGFKESGYLIRCYFPGVIDGFTFDHLNDRVGTGIGIATTVDAMTDALDGLIVNHQKKFDRVTTVAGFFCVTIRVGKDFIVIVAKSHLKILGRVILPKIKAFFSHALVYTFQIGIPIRCRGLISEEPEAIIAVGYRWAEVRKAKRCCQALRLDLQIEDFTDLV